MESEIGKGLEQGGNFKMLKHKIMIFALVALLVIGGIGTVWGTQIAEAASGVWNSCPRGITNCRYPGKCNLYIDTNSDKICDRSQAAPQTAAATLTATEVAKAAAITNSTGTAVTASTPAATVSIPQVITKSGSSGISAGGTVAEVAPAGNSNTASISSQNEAGTTSTESGLKHSYYFVPILLVMGILYTVTWTLSARKVIKTLLHRKIWNMVLLVTMLVSALLGLFLILAIDFNIEIELPFNMLFWHVEAGIALSIIAVFHILWHWRYFAKMIKVTA
jgi:hypothetical protein